jgi:hypothetical protein
MTYSISIYKVWLETNPELFYIGSSKSKLSTRMAGHRQKARQGRTSLIYQTMRDKGINNFSCVLVETHNVGNSDEQRQKEQECIVRLKPPLNEHRAYATEEEKKQQQRECDIRFRENPNNKEKIKAYRKQDYERHKQAYLNRAAERTLCECGKMILTNSTKRHIETKSHRQKVARAPVAT